MIVREEFEFDDVVSVETPLIPEWENPLREALVRDAAQDELGVARCPACQEPLQLRCDAAGPHFACRCALTPAPRRAA